MFLIKFYNNYYRTDKLDFIFNNNVYNMLYKLENSLKMLKNCFIYYYFKIKI